MSQQEIIDAYNAAAQACREARVALVAEAQANPDTWDPTRNLYAYARAYVDAYTALKVAQHELCALQEKPMPPDPWVERCSILATHNKRIQSATATTWRPRGQGVISMRAPIQIEASGNVQVGMDNNSLCGWISICTDGIWVREGALRQEAERVIDAIHAYIANKDAEWGADVLADRNAEKARLDELERLLAGVGKP